MTQPSKDYTLRCRECEGKLAKSDIVMENLAGTMYQCTNCRGYYLMTLDGNTMIAMEAQK